MLSLSINKQCSATRWTTLNYSYLSLLRDRTRSAHSALHDMASWNSPRMPYMPQPAQFRRTSASGRSEGTAGAPKFEFAGLVGVAEESEEEEEASRCFPGEPPLPGPKQGKMYRVGLVVWQLGWVDLDLECSTILLGQ